jgi:hypothetical protein
LLIKKKKNLVHISQVGWSIIPDLLDRGVGVGGTVSKTIGCKLSMINTKNKFITEAAERVSLPQNSSLTANQRNTDALATQA